MAARPAPIPVLELLVSSQLGGGPAHVADLLGGLDPKEFRLVGQPTQRHEQQLIAALQQRATFVQPELAELGAAVGRLGQHILKAEVQFIQ